MVEETCTLRTILTVFQCSYSALCNVSQSAQFRGRQNHCTACAVALVVKHSQKKSNRELSVPQASKLAANDEKDHGSFEESPGPTVVETCRRLKTALPSWEDVAEQHGVFSTKKPCTQQAVLGQTWPRKQARVAVLDTLQFQHHRNSTRGCDSGGFCLPRGINVLLKNWKSNGLRKRDDGR